MRRTILSLTLISLSLCALAQTPSLSKNDEQTIQHVKSLLASSFDSRLPRVSLEYFLAYETDGAPAKWIIGGCSRQSTDNSDGVGHNRPICVQADFDLNDGGALTILIRVEESQNWKLADASLMTLTVTKSTGNFRQIRSLGDLPMELHRAFPSKIPKDLPPPSSDG
jgi:hypothetical protein